MKRNKAVSTIIVFIVTALLLLTSIPFPEELLAVIEASESLDPSSIPINWSDEEPYTEFTPLSLYVSKKDREMYKEEAESQVSLISWDTEWEGPLNIEYAATHEDSEFYPFTDKNMIQAFSIFNSTGDSLELTKPSKLRLKYDDIFSKTLQKELSKEELSNLTLYLIQQQEEELKATPIEFKIYNEEDIQNDSKLYEYFKEDLFSSIVIDIKNNPYGNYVFIDESIEESKPEEDIQIKPEEDSIQEEQETEEEELPNGIDIEEVASEDDLDFLDEYDFTSNRILVTTDNPSDIRPRDNVVGVMNNIYLIQFETEDKCREAYGYYYLNNIRVETDVVLAIAEEETEQLDLTTDTVMSESLNPFTAIEELTETAKPKNYDIALIDTGAEGKNVTSVSVIGETVSDDHGHGTNMLKIIQDIHPDASILSIKALDLEGKGDTSAIYSAIQYAIEQNVSIINLSMSAYASSGSQVLFDLIQTATNQGIIVVGASGNRGENVKNFIPGQIEEATIVGACDENGVRLSNSNYGSTLDYNLIASSTSDAAAKMSAYLSLYNLNYDKLLSTRLIFTPDHSEDGNEEFIEPEGRESEFTIAQTEHDCKISYKDGSKISSVAKVNPTKFNKMHKILGSFITSSCGSNWNSGWSDAPSNQSPVWYFLAPKGYSTHGKTITYQYSNYDVKVTVKATYNSGANKRPVVFTQKRFAVCNCSVYNHKTNRKTANQAFDFTKYFLAADGSEYLGVALDVNVYVHGTSTRVSLPSIYEIVTDIDEAQSYKRINSGDAYNSHELIIHSKSVFDTDYRKTGFYRSIKSNGDIYVPYNVKNGVINTIGGKGSDSPPPGRVYSKTTKIQSQTLQMTFGYHKGACSTVGWASPQWTVTYEKQPGQESAGTLSRASENVWELNTPAGCVATGAQQNATYGWKFDYWTAKTAIYKSDGSLYAAAGAQINMDNFKTLKVVQDITLVAHFKYSSVGTHKISMKKAITGEPNNFDLSQFKFNFYSDAACTTKTLGPVNFDSNGNYTWTSGVQTFSTSNAGGSQTWTYYMKEEPGTIPGMTYDTSVYKVTTTLKDNKNGTTTQSNTYQKISPTTGTLVTTTPSFINNYIKPKADINIEASKLFYYKYADNTIGPDISLEKKNFTVQLKDSNGSVIQTNTFDTTNNKTSFTIKQLTEGTYNYTLSEVPATPTPTSLKGGYTTDNKIIYVRAVITEVEGQSNANAVVYYSTNANGPFNSQTTLSFENTYRSKGTAVVTAQKKLIGGSLSEHPYKFGLWDNASYSGDPIYTAYTTSAGNVNFTFNYDRIPDQVPVYYLKEIIDTAAPEYENTIYDTSKYTVTIQLVDDFNGKINSTVTYKKSLLSSNPTTTAPTFTNTYVGDNASLTIEGLKVFNGGRLQDHKFTFELYEFGEVNYRYEDQTPYLNDGRPIQTVQCDENGQFQFNLEYGLSGVGDHSYIIKEAIPDPSNQTPNMTYDTTEYYVFVEVTRDGSELNANVTYCEKEVNVVSEILDTSQGNSFTTINPTQTFNINENNYITINERLTFKPGITGYSMKFDVVEHTGDINLNINNVYDWNLAISNNSNIHICTYFDDFFYDTDSQQIDEITIRSTGTNASATIKNVRLFMDIPADLGNIIFTNTYTPTPTTTSIDIKKELTTDGPLDDYEMHLEQIIPDTPPDSDTPELIDDPVLFSSPSPFTLSTAGLDPGWDGILEYSTDDTNWTTWDGTTELTAGRQARRYVLYLRGENNTCITDGDEDHDFHINGSDVTISGSLSNLLDRYEVVTPADGAFNWLFSGNDSIIDIKNLNFDVPITPWCYSEMFAGCRNLTTTPELPETTLAPWCYSEMFAECRNLTTLIKLPATELPIGCYSGMFSECSKLKLSESRTGEYQTAYRIPTSGTGILLNEDEYEEDPDYPVYEMFSSTGGSFKGTPSINTTYYVSTTNTLVGQSDTIRKNYTNTFREETDSYNNYSIALLDTGSNVSEGAISVVGDNAGDATGHGTDMTHRIKEQNPSAKILSIRVTDDEGKASPEAVAKAVYIAMQKQIPIINLSMAGSVDTNSQVAIDAIQTAIKSGVRIVGAAGNFSSDAVQFIPGCIPEAIIVGASNPNGTRLDISNYGETVDLYEAANNTSEATAIVSGKLSKNIQSASIINKTNKINTISKGSNTDSYLYPMRPDYVRLASSNAFSLSSSKTWDGTIQYSTDLNSWTTWNGGAIVAQPTTDMYNIYLRGRRNTRITRSNASTGFSITGSSVSLYGSLSTLLDYTTQATPTSYAFNRLFYSTPITDAAYLKINVPLSNSCCSEMFKNCALLKTAPSLPATTLAQSCYQSMFEGCSSLQVVPELPATTLEQSCYSNMFKGSGIVFSPELPATNLAPNCYDSMFYNCTQLLTLPKLLSTTTSESECYKNMFYGCTLIKLRSTKTSTFNSLSGVYTQEYKLPSNTATDAFLDMFTGTGGSFTGTPSSGSTYYLFADYIKLSSPDQFTLSCASKRWYNIEYYTSATTGWTSWDGTAITSGRISGSYAIYLRGQSNSSISSTYGSFNNKFQITGSNVSISGNLSTLFDYTTKRSSASSDSCYALFYNNLAITDISNLIIDIPMSDNCCHYMFSGCKNLTTVPLLPITTLSDSCYEDMFYSCTKLTTAPILPATTLAVSCYNGMFFGCSSLQDAPELPATNLAPNCYVGMFYNCNLYNSPMLPATNLADSCYADMLVGNRISVPPYLPATTLEQGCYEGMLAYNNILISASKKGIFQIPYSIPPTLDGTDAPDALREMFVYNSAPENFSDWSSFEPVTEDWSSSGLDINTIYYLPIEGYSLTVVPNNGILNSGSTNIFGDMNGTSLPVTINSNVLRPNRTDLNKIGTVTRSGYIFKGFYTKLTGGVLVYDTNGNYVVGKYWNENGEYRQQSNLVVYAHWEKQYDDFNETIRTNSDGIASKTFTFTSDDIGETYSYYVTEVAGDKYKMTYDDTVYRIDLHVIDNLDGTIGVEKSIYRVGDDVIPVSEIKFLNKPYVAEGTVLLNGLKVINNGKVPLNEKRFQFGLWDNNTCSGDPITPPVLSDENGHIQFVVGYSGTPLESTWTQTVYTKEIVPNTTIPNMTYDSAIKPITIQWTDNNDGTASGVVSGDITTRTFNNIVETDPINVSIPGEKLLSGLLLSQIKSSNKFNFGLYEMDGTTLVTTGSISDTNYANNNGSFTFNPIQYTIDDVGEHHYLAKEIPNENLSFKFDPREFEVIVTISLSEDGLLTSDISYGDEGAVTFYNEFSDKAYAIIEAQKTLSAGSLADHRFKFSLFADGDPDDPITEVSTDSEGKARILLPFTSADLRSDDETGVDSKSFYYTLEEVDEELPYYTYSKAVYRVKVDVSIDENNILSCSTSYALLNPSEEEEEVIPDLTPSDNDDEEGESVDIIEEPINWTTTIPTFHNEYLAEGTAHIFATKLYLGAKTTIENFEFGLYKSDGVTLLQRGVYADSAGNIEFTRDYNQNDIGTTENFVIKEFSENPISGVRYDTQSYQATVTVVDNRDGTLNCNVVYPDTNIENGFPQFVNRDNVPGVAVIQVQKTINNGLDMLPTHPVKFGLYSDSSTNTQLQEAITNNSGIASFAVTYENPGTYTYYMREIVPTQLDGLEYNNRTIQVNVAVTPGEGSDLNTQVTYGTGINATSDIPIYNNTYKMSGEVILHALKTLIGGELSDYTFTVNAYKDHDKTTLIGSGVSDVDGNIALTIQEQDVISTEPIVTTSYLLEEDVPNNLPSWQIYDTRTYEVSVTWEDMGNNLMKPVNIQYYDMQTGVRTPITEEEVVYTNEFFPEGEATIQIQKEYTCNNPDHNNETFTFQLYNDEDELVQEKSVNGSGTITFDTIPLTRDDLGTNKYYRILEVAGTVENVTYDSTEYNACITTTDNHDGTLNSTVRYYTDSQIPLDPEDTDPIGTTDAPVFHNTYAEPTNEIHVSKIVTGNMGSKDTPFAFTITLTGTDMADAQLEYQKGSDEGNITLTNNTYSFTLAHGEDIWIKEVPVGTTYTITETLANLDGYTTTITQGSATGVVPEQTAGWVQVTFNNNRTVAVPTRVRNLTYIGMAVIAGLIATLTLILLKLRRRRESGDK